MKKIISLIIVSVLISIYFPLLSMAQEDIGDECTNIIVTKGAGTTSICKGVQSMVQEGNISIAGQGVKY